VGSVGSKTAGGGSRVEIDDPRQIIPIGISIWKFSHSRRIHSIGYRLGDPGR
jgi:hypothetical protein